MNLLCTVLNVKNVCACMSSTGDCVLWIGVFCPGTRIVVAARLQAGSRLIHTEPGCCPTAWGPAQDLKCENDVNSLKNACCMLETRLEETGQDKGEELLRKRSALVWSALSLLGQSNGSWVLLLGQSLGSQDRTAWDRTTHTACGCPSPTPQQEFCTGPN